MSMDYIKAAAYIEAEQLVPENGIGFACLALRAALVDNAGCEMDVEEIFHEFFALDDGRFWAINGNHSRQFGCWWGYRHPARITTLRLAAERAY